MRMRPMSLFESGHSTGGVSLATLLDGEPAQAPDPGTTLLEYLGFLFESLAVRGLRIHAQAADAQVLGVIVATGFAYRRPDGVAVVPIGTLGP